MEPVKLLALDLDGTLLDTLYDLPVDRCTDEEIEMLVEYE